MDKHFIENRMNGFFESKEYSYDEMFNLMQDVINGSCEDGVSIKEANKKIREMMLEVFELDEKSVQSPKLINRAIRKHKDEFFEIIEDVVSDMLKQGWDSDPFFMNYVETKNIADGDANEFYAEKETILSVHEVAGDHHDITVQRLGDGETFSAKVKRYACAVGTDIRLYLLGRVDFSKMINAVYEAFDKKIKADIYAELANVGAKLPVASEFNKALAINATNKPVIDELIEMVAGANGGEDVVLVGTASAVKQLEKLTDVNWISNDAKNDKYRTGRVGMYEGHGIVEIPQQLMRNSDGTLSKLVDSKQILVLPAGMDNPIKFVNVGNPSIYEVNEIGDHMDDTMKFEYSQSFGTAVVIGKYFGNIKITD